MPAGAAVSGLGGKERKYGLSSAEPKTDTLPEHLSRMNGRVSGIGKEDRAGEKRSCPPPAAVFPSFQSFLGGGAGKFGVSTPLSSRKRKRRPSWMTFPQEVPQWDSRLSTIRQSCRFVSFREFFMRR